MQVANILLRLVWMQSVLDFNETEFLHRRAIVALVGCLEIFRRGIWNFFRFVVYPIKRSDISSCFCIVESSMV